MFPQQSGEYDQRAFKHQQVVETLRLQDNVRTIPSLTTKLPFITFALTLVGSIFKACRGEIISILRDL